MATESASLPVNGTYAPHNAQQFNPTEPNNVAHSANSNYGAPSPSVTSNNPSDAVQDITKEEIGWYFVERYYTTMSKRPDNLFLFYNKRSRSVFGVEDEKAPVCVGQTAINDRMKELDFQDCKIRVTNVDSQESGADIVIQVIGEISNKSAPHRKFVQTFVLARQTNGYFVLTDIFRYIAEEEEELEDQDESQAQSANVRGAQEQASTAQESEPKGLSSSTDAAEQEHDAHLVDEGLEKVAEQDSKPPPAVPTAKVNGTSVPDGADVAVADDAPVAAVAAPTEPTTATPDAAADLQPEKPKDPEPSPAPTPAAPANAPSAPKAPSAPTKAAAPRTWASLAASANRSAPLAATPAVAMPAQPQQKAASPAATPAVPAPAAPASQTPAREPSETDAQPGDGWQAVGGGHDRKQSRAQGQVGAEAPRFRAYVKNVFPNVDADALKSQLSKYGELSYFDVSRQKNCAFVDFATQAGFHAAVTANPLKIGNDEVFVEERRERPFQFQPRGGIRGGRGGPENRPGQGRGGFGKDNVRGGYQPRGRGGNITPRGRGTGQTA